MFKAARILTILLLSVTAVNAIIAGILFMLDPSGALMGMDLDYIQHSPFQTYLIPGIILSLVIGIMNIVAAIFLWRKNVMGTYLAILQGILLCGWIGIQVTMVRDFNLLHASMLIFGLIFIMGGCFMRYSKN